MYENDIEMHKLKLYLQLLPDTINLMHLDGIPIRENTCKQFIIS